MKVRKSILLESRPIKVEPNKINLSSITKIVNNLNEIIAPEIDKSIVEDKKELDNELNKYKNGLLHLKELNKEITEYKINKNNINKKIEIVSLLSELHLNFKLNDKIKTETLSILNSLNEMGTKRLDAQIEKLKKVLAK